jgi:hypothetical protein
MPTIKLGLSGSEFTLPSTRWAGGNQPEPPVTYGPSPDRIVMLDGSVHINFKSARYRKWQLEFSRVTAAELRDFFTIVGYNEALRYQNTWASDDWIDVIADPGSFSYVPLNPADVSADIIYSVSLTIEEINV